MDFDLSIEQRELRATVRSFLEKSWTKDRIDDLESRHEYPLELWNGFAKLGLFGLGVPEEYGGAGGGMLEIVVACEEIGRFGGSAIFTYMPTGVFGNQTLLGGASPELRERFLPRMAVGELRTAFALTEPDAGSDAAALRTRAVRDGDAWVLDGSKTWCSGALAADYLVLSARVGGREERHPAITVFLVDTRSPGLTMRAIPKLGHLAVSSCEIGLSNVRVPHELMVGQVGGGWRALLRTLDAERIAVGAVCTGSSQRCLDMALEYGLQRRQFDRPIASFQAISHLLADMETETNAARLMTYQAAWLMDGLGRASKHASMAKAYATELATRSATRGMQVLGGYSYSREFEMERFYREAKLYEVAGGTTQIQRNIIAHHLGIPD
jgi:alkylation response protein AidB-like acyl-CoA dehydrogenase